MSFSNQLMPDTRTLRISLSLAAAVLLNTPVMAADKTDVVEFGNGNRMVGEVKALSRGKLSFKTDATGTISIDWDEVHFLSIDEEIQVEVQDGTRYFGRLTRADEDGFLVVQTAAGPVELLGQTVIGMNSIDEHGFRGVDLSVSGGYNFTKASNVTQFNVGVNASYRTRKRIITGDLASVISDSSNNDVSQRQALTFNYTRLRSNRWLNDGGISFDRNDELGLNLRTSLSAGGGRIMTQSNSSSFMLKAGLKATRENNVDSSEDIDSIESYGMLIWEWFRFDTPELDWSTSLEIIPSLTESGRVRGEFDATLSWEVIGDLYWQLSFYDSYDSQPQSETTPTNDYGVTTSLSYDF